MGSNAPIGLGPGVPRDAVGQDAAKYGSRNGVVRLLLERWTRRLAAVIGPETGTVLDIGVGEGFSLERILAMPAITPRRVAAVEYRVDKANAARRLDGVGVMVGDAGMVPVPDRVADLVLCIEVLEHLPTVAPAVAELARVTATSGRCVVSVPWEPWFRLGNLGRGKNARRLGNDPEHIGWFTPKRLHQALDPYFDQVRIRRAFPWLVGEACRPREGGR